MSMSIGVDSDIRIFSNYAIWVLFDGLHDFRLSGWSNYLHRDAQTFPARGAILLTWFNFNPSMDE